MTAYYIFIREKLFHPRRDAHFQSIIKTVYDPWYFISFEDKFELIDSSDVCRCIMYIVFGKFYAYRPRMAYSMRRFHFPR